MIAMMEATDTWYFLRVVIRQGSTNSRLGTRSFGRTRRKRSFGTILVGIGFASYLVQVLEPAVEVTPSHKDKSHVKYATR